MAQSIIQAKSFEFALAIIDLYRRLQQKHEYVISKQLFRSGTSIGANVEEGAAGQSRNDFVAKMAIASNEGRETRYWLRLLQGSKLGEIDVAKELGMAEEINRILHRSSKRRAKQVQNER